ncbi:MAG: four helix bundle protein [Bacteroidetes bacterium]|nr:four helix bundle protein [Bacteroidota bacterium]
MTTQELKNRTKTFSHRCVKLALSMSNSFLENHIRGQLIRASTSVAANYRAACLAHSKKSFSSKLSIVIEETDESCFWMEFLIEENLMKENMAAPLIKESNELLAIFISSRKTIQVSSNKQIRTNQSSIINNQL